MSFANPPNGARPRVWWHWVDDNISKEGIRKDLEWMHRVGIGGLQNFDVALRTPQVVRHRLAYMSQGWKEAFRYSAALADHLGLELAVASSPGWSETGGPWVSSQDAMKKLVWSETALEGGQKFVGILAQPPRTTGPFQDTAQLSDDITAPADQNPPTYYSDAAVVAYRLPDDTAPVAQPQITLGNGIHIDASLLEDGRAATGVLLPSGTAAAPTTLTIEYPAPRTVRAITIAVGVDDRAYLRPVVEVEDGVGGWRRLADADLSAAPQTIIAFAPQTTIAFPATRARTFLVKFTPLTPPSVLDGVSSSPGAVTDILPASAKRTSFQLTELRFETEPRVNYFELKAGYAIARDYYSLDSEAPNDSGPDPSSVVDLTQKMAVDGELDWTPPPGRWKVLRLGYSLEGKTNHPATREATGLEVDKHNPAAVRRYLETYLGMYRDITGPNLIGRRGVRALVTDSTEVGPSNWTPNMIADFERLRGYDIRPWLPVLTGAVIGSTRQSDAFLYDFRRTLADLMASAHYKTILDVAHEHGLRVYGESLEGIREVLGDDMTMRAYTDIPMSALWTYSDKDGPDPAQLGDMKGASSLAHVYGQNLAAAESMTSVFSPWAFAPRDLKKFIDLEFAYGINRPVIHTSVHQPLDKAPGLSLWIIGQYFNRLDTWADMAKPWIDYISRNAFMLQQGRNVADAAYFVGEERPSSVLFGDGALADLPQRYAYDLINSGMLLRALNVKGSELVTPGGARYRLLYLGGTSHKMTLPVLRRVAELASAGATVVGNRPTSSPSLADDPLAFESLADRLWGGGPVTRVGRGRVIAGSDADTALMDLGMSADFSYDSGRSAAHVLFVHRKLPQGEIYYLDNRDDRPQHIQARFRVAGKVPELWHAETGRSESVSYRIHSGETVIPLEMAAFESFFIVFRNPARRPSRILPPRVWSPELALDRPWRVTFQRGRGAPSSATFAALAPLSENANRGIRYFSGVATYRTSFWLPRRIRPQGQWLLDLGEVGDVAQVFVNGRPAGTAWHPPFRLPLSGFVRPGFNRLKVKVADLWVNRLIGDQQPGAKKITFTTEPTYRADAPLRRSGLIGPVKLLGTDRR